MQKNAAGQKWKVFAFDRLSRVPTTGDAANITAKLAIDYGDRTALTDTNPTEAQDGYYLFDLAQAETNGDVLDLYPQSATSGVQVIGCPGTVYTLPDSFTAYAAPLTAADMAAAVWDILGSGHTGTGTTGEDLQSGS